MPHTRTRLRSTEKITLNCNCHFSPGLCPDTCVCHAPVHVFTVPGYLSLRASVPISLSAMHSYTSSQYRNMNCDSFLSGPLSLYNFLQRSRTCLHSTGILTLNCGSHFSLALCPYTVDCHAIVHVFTIHGYLH